MKQREYREKQQYKQPNREQNEQIFKSTKGRRRCGRNYCSFINRGGVYREIQGKEESPSANRRPFLVS